MTVRICATPGCGTCLSRYAPAGLDLCAACEKRQTDARLAVDVRDNLSAKDRRAPREAAVKPVEPPPSRPPPAEHVHFGPIATRNTTPAERIEWRPASQWNSSATMVAETCGCQRTRYELMRLGGRRLIRRTNGETGAVHETNTLRVSEADALWKLLLSGHSR
ncbi:MAG: hypothetical protein ABIS86_16925 [Streptosporangiaceae bacterium]